MRQPRLLVTSIPGTMLASGPSPKRTIEGHFLATPRDLGPKVGPLLCPPTWAVCYQNLYNKHMRTRKRVHYTALFLASLRDTLNLSYTFEYNLWMVLASRWAFRGARNGDECTHMYEDRHPSLQHSNRCQAFVLHAIHAAHGIQLSIQE